MKFKKNHIPWNKGKQCNETHKKKISESNKGKTPWNKGLKMTKPSKKIGTKQLSTKGDKNPAKRPEVRKKISDALKGRSISKEWRRKMSISAKNKFKNGYIPPITNDLLIRKKISESLIGHSVSKKTKEKIRKARLNQKNTWESSIEIIIQNKLKENNIKFKKHKVISNIEHKYQCDIFIEPNIVIECDGNYWHNYPHGTEKDKIRNKELNKQGYIVLRFWESDINNDLNKCLNRIMEVIK